MIPPARPGGRPRDTDVRRVLDALFYLVKTGCPWRLLPSEFPPWQTVYGYFARWGRKGILKKIQAALVEKIRRQEGRRAVPSIVIVDSQSVKTGKVGGDRGFDGGKRVKGRKRHLAVDSLGLPLAVSVTPANVHDLRGGKRVLQAVRKFLRGRPLSKIYADGSYDSRKFRSWIDARFKAKLVVSPNLAHRAKAFVPVSQRWVVERSFAWILDYRRLSLDYERTTQHSRFMLRLAAIRLMMRRWKPSFWPSPEPPEVRRRLSAL